MYSGWSRCIYRYLALRLYQMKYEEVLKMDEIKSSDGICRS